MILSTMKSNKHKLLILSRDSDAYDEILRESGLEGLEFQAFSSPDKLKTNL
jgi:hypothetical protein